MHMEKKLQVILLLFFLSFSLFIIMVFFNQPISKFTRAKEDLNPSATNSLLFAYPLTVKADGKTASAISVFIRSENGLPSKNRRVTINSTLGILKETSLITDEEGKAATTLVSPTSGVAEITALFDAVPLAQKLTIKFE
jgi:hypothetical protein